MDFELAYHKLVRDVSITFCNKLGKLRTWYNNRRAFSTFLIELEDYLYICLSWLCCLLPNAVYVFKNSQLSRVPFNAFTGFRACLYSYWFMHVIDDKRSNFVCFILFYFILFYFILFYFILFYFIYFILFYYISRVSMRMIVRWCPRANEITNG